jgi:hypothetical protein
MPLLYRVCTRAGHGAGTNVKSSSAIGRRSARADGQAGAGTERIVGRDGVIARGLKCLVGNLEVQDAVVDLFELNLGHSLNPFFWLPGGALLQRRIRSSICM